VVGWILRARALAVGWGHVERRTVMVRALGREVRRLVVGLVAAVVAIGGVAVVLAWMGDQLVETVGGL